MCKEELEQASAFVKGRLVQQNMLQYLSEQPSGWVDYITAMDFFEHVEVADTNGGV